MADRTITDLLSTIRGPIEDYRKRSRRFAFQCDMNPVYNIKESFFKSVVRVFYHLYPFQSSLRWQKFTISASLSSKYDV